MALVTAHTSLSDGAPVGPVELAAGSYILSGVAAAGANVELLSPGLPPVAIPLTNSGFSLGAPANVCIVTTSPGQLFLSSIDATTPGLFKLGEYTATVDVTEPNAILEVGGVKQLVKFAANDGSDALPEGTFETAGGVVTVKTLGRHRTP